MAMSRMKDYNQLNGTIPMELGRLTSLTYLDLGGKSKDVFCCSSVGVNVALLYCN
jgi:hypothetical protein